MSRVSGGTTASRGGGQRSAGDRPTRPTGTRDFLRSLVSEMRRVTWPSRDEWVAATLLTVGLVVAIAAYTYALDEGFGALFTVSGAR